MDCPMPLFKKKKKWIVLCANQCQMSTFNLVDPVIWTLLDKLASVCSLEGNAIFEKIKGSSRSFTRSAATPIPLLFYVVTSLI